MFHVSLHECASVCSTNYFMLTYMRMLRIIAYKSINTHTHTHILTTVYSNPKEGGYIL